MEFTELGEFLQSSVHTYSSGMAMRLIFVVATANSSEIMLIDEMLSTEDASFQDKSKARIQKLISAADIFVLASHDPNMIKPIAIVYFAGAA